ncbi:hypothetical protein UB48_21665 [Pseudomonas sp. 2(2015)]|nr:hypothetical protein UB48_21665 [Pseudomonas sp. 2(2015)]
MREDLKALFLPFNGIEVLAIVAHTDPIGGTEDNKLLGEKRAQFIRNMIQEIIAAPARSQQFSDNPLPTDGVLDGPKKSDFAFWQSCFKDYYLDVKDGFYPLLNLSRKKNIDNRPACTEATAETGRDGLYPACARLKIPEPDQPYPKGYAQRAERLQQLTACLAPMRHVFIKFRFDHQVQAPSQ